MNIGTTGIWDTNSKETYEFDMPLAFAIAGFFQKMNVADCADLGCGAGKYTDYLNNAGIRTTGYDGNPNSFLMSEDCFGNFDLSVPFRIDPVDAVLSLEVGEHIPREFENIFLDNLTKNSKRFVVLSWFPIPGHGIGHVNERDNDWVKNQMLLRGFKSMNDVEKFLRDSSSLWWFKESLLVFSRNG